jgi:hypothetical protein
MRRDDAIVAVPADKGKPTLMPSQPPSPQLYIPHRALVQQLLLAVSRSPLKAASRRGDCTICKSCTPNKTPNIRAARAMQAQNAAQLSDHSHHTRSRHTGAVPLCNQCNSSTALAELRHQSRRCNLSQQVAVMSADTHNTTQPPMYAR